MNATEAAPRGGYVVIHTGPVWRVLDMWEVRPGTCVATLPTEFAAHLWITESTLFGGVPE